MFVLYPHPLACTWLVGRLGFLLLSAHQVSFHEDVDVENQHGLLGDVKRVEVPAGKSAQLPAKTASAVLAT